MPAVDLAGVAHGVATATGIASNLLGTFTNPIVLNPAAASAPIDFSWSAPEVLSAPAFEAGDAAVGVQWYSYTPTDSGDLTLSLAPLEAVVIEVYGDSGGVLVDFSASLATPLVLPLSGGQTYLIRVHPQNAADPYRTWSFSLDYTYATVVATLQVQYTGGGASVTVATTPIAVSIDVMNGPANETFTVAVEAGSESATLATFMTDQFGVAQGIVVLVGALDYPYSLSVGSYLLAITSSPATGSLTGTLDFIVTTAPDPLPTPVSPDAPIPTTSVTGIVKWRLIDAAPGGEIYEFDINPDRMSSPNPPKTFSVDKTTAGTPITWEGARVATHWTFSGTLEQRSQLDAIGRFLELNRRVWIVDHFNRGWVVTLERFDPKPLKDVEHPDAHTYTVNALIYSGPVQTGPAQP